LAVSHALTLTAKAISHGILKKFFGLDALPNAQPRASSKNRKHNQWLTS